MVSSLLPLLCAVLGLASFVQVAVASDWIVPGANWTDTNGARIQAHGGGLFYENGKYYWVGEDKTGNTGSFKNGFHMYSSTDLRNWSDNGLVLKPQANTPISATNVGERPKIIKNSSGQYVLWFHSEDSGYALANVGVATASSITGPYTYQASWRPLGQESRDMSVFVDTDGTGYLCFATNGNADFAIAKMTSDLKNVTSLVYTFSGVRYEGSGLIQRNGVYNLIVSHQSSWAPNDNLVLTAKSLSGPWSSPQNIAPVGLNTYNSQNNFDQTFAGSATTSYMYLGDRWRVDYLGESTYMWMPYVFNASTGASKIDRSDVWKVDPATGTVTKPAASNAFNANSGRKGSATKTSNCSTCPSGQIVGYIGNSSNSTGSLTINSLSTPNGSAGTVWVSIYYSNGDAYPGYRNCLVRAGSGSNQNVLFAPGGQPNGAGLQSSPLQLAFQAGSQNSITFSNPSSYCPDISHVIVYQTN